MAYTFALFLGFNLMGCEGTNEENANNELQRENTEPRARREADSRGIEPSSDLIPNNDNADLSVTKPDIGGHEMMAGQTVSENITSGTNLSTFASLIRHAEVVGQLSQAGPYTVFAPSNEAFEALPENELENLMKPENKQRLQQLVNNHVVSGTMSVRDLQDGATLRTVGGAQLQVTKRNNTLAVNGAEVAEANIVSSNGVVHIVNKVLAARQ
ncbi:hypothetical protein GCM10027443_31730 [Pontibacter brevis]